MRVKDYIKQLEDALDNFVGFHDTPIERSRHPFGSFIREATETAKEVRKHGAPKIAPQDVEWSIKDALKAEEAGLI